MGCIHIQMLPKALAAGAPLQTPNSEGERFRPLPVWHSELYIVLRLFKNGFHLHPNAPKSVGGWGSAPDPPIARESGRAPSALASLTRKIENGVNAIQKWVPFTPNCSQVPKALVAGAPPHTPPKARESAFALASLTRRREGRQFPSSPRTPETLGKPLTMIVNNDLDCIPDLLLTHQVYIHIHHPQEFSPAYLPTAPSTQFNLSRFFP